MHDIQSVKATNTLPSRPQADLKSAPSTPRGELPYEKSEEARRHA